MRLAPRSSAATRARGAATRPSPASAALTRRGAAVPRPAPRRSARGPFPRPAPARAEPPPPPPTSRTQRFHELGGVGLTIGGRSDGHARMPSGEPPSTTARTPSWRKTAWASERSASGCTSSRRATTTPPSDSAWAARLFASASLDCWRSRESSCSASRCRSITRPMAGEQLVGLRAQQLGSRLDQPLALDGPSQRRLAGEGEDAPGVRADGPLREQG